MIGVTGHPSRAPVGRTMPHSIEAEEYLLACCLLDGADVISRCVEAKISARSFFDTKHGIVYDGLLDLYDRQKPVAIHILAEELKTRQQLDEIGGYAFLAQVSTLVPTTAQSGYFIEKVREQALLREMIRSATGVVEDCFSFSGGIDELVESAEAKFFAVTQSRVADCQTSLPTVVDNAMATLTAMTARKGEMTGVRSGYRDLDQLTWGFQRSDVIVLAARPSMGKTALALNMAENAAMPARANLKPESVMIFSLEMAAPQLAMRLLCSRARVSMKLLREGLLPKNGDEQARLATAAAELKRAPIYIDDSSSITVSQIRAKARRQHARSPLGMIMVDYLGLIAPSDPRVPREQQVAEASRHLKALAKELGVPVVVLSQLSRASEKDNRRPKLSDLRESGAIEQDADVVLMLARPKEADDNFQVAADSADLIVAKQRNGPVGDLRLTFLREIGRFENYHA